MAQWELRPLSLGEILDRTFTLYRRHFLLFFGIAAIPHLLTLVLNLSRVLLMYPGSFGRRLPSASGGLLAFGLFGGLIGLIIYIVAYLFMHGGTIYAVSDLYLGRQTTISSSLGRMWGQLANLFGVSLLNGFAVAAATILFIIPGIIVGCRLSTCVPAALLEDLGARSSLERSWDLTKGFAGRAFLIFLLYICMLYAVVMLFAIPIGILIATAGRDPGTIRTYMALMQVGNFFAGVIVSPFILIATSVFYYDLRVRKEAFDLQLMMDPSGKLTSGQPVVPSILS